MKKEILGAPGHILNTHLHRSCTCHYFMSFTRSYENATSYENLLNFLVRCYTFQISPNMANQGLGKMHLDLYTSNSALTHKAKFWCNYVGALKGKFSVKRMKMCGIFTMCLSASLSSRSVFCLFFENMQGCSSLNILKKRLGF